MAKAKVKMRTTTNWEGELRRPGDELLVDVAVAKRWERNRLAEILQEEKVEKGKRGKDKTPQEANDPPDDQDPQGDKTE